MKKFTDKALHRNKGKIAQSTYHLGIRPSHRCKRTQGQILSLDPQHLVALRLVTFSLMYCHPELAQIYSTVTLWCLVFELLQESLTYRQTTSKVF